MLDDVAIVDVAAAVHDDARRGHDVPLVGDSDVLAGGDWHAREAPHGQRGVERRDSAGCDARDRYVAFPRGGRAGVDQHTAPGPEEATGTDEPVDLTVGESPQAQP